jgi:hypothetical protein
VQQGSQWQRQQRTTLRRLARQIRQQDPDLARLLSGGGRWRVPAVHLTSVPTAGYAIVGAVLLAVGFFLGVGSAVFWGLVAVGAAVLRRNRDKGLAPSRGRGRGAPDRRGSV